MHQPATDTGTRASLDLARAWLTEHGDMLFSLAMRDLQHTHDAEEVVQETLLAAMSAESTFEGRSTPQTWLVAILRYKIADFIRRQRVRRGKPTSDGVEAAVPESLTDSPFTFGKWSRRIPAKAFHTGSQAEFEEFRTALNRCVEKLPDRTAHALRLVEHHALSADQTSKILGVSTTNICVMLYRARLALRDCLNKTWFKSKA